MLAELKQIRTLLTPAPTPPPAAPVGMKDEFMAFVKKYKLLGMAVAFIIAIYLGAARPGAGKTTSSCRFSSMSYLMRPLGKRSPLARFVVATSSGRSSRSSLSCFVIFGINQGGKTIQR